VHEIKLDGYRMAARIDNGRVQLLTRTGLDWTDRYPSVIAPYAPVAVAGWRLGTTRKNAELYGCL
jgi:bifunctional non-homologous end joining protein LigD